MSARACALALATSLALVSGWIPCGTARAQDRDVKVYVVKHRTAEELIDVAETALDGAGRVAADRRSNTLVLTGDPSAVERALAVLASLDIARRSVSLRYESVRARTLEAQGIAVTWSVTRGPVRVGNVRARGDSRVVIELDDRERRVDDRLAGQLRILDGETGRISTGTTVPITTRTIDQGPFGPVVRETTEYVSADSGFQATPRVLGDHRIELVLRPFSATLEGGRIDATTADTAIVLVPGQTVALGGLLQSTQRSGRDGLFGTRKSEESDDTLLLITADLE